MNPFRTLSTRRLLVLVASLVVVAAGGAAIAVAARGGGPTPPPKPLDQAIHDALTAPEPAGITARIQFTNHLFPSGALLGQAGSALLSGASGRLWMTNDGRGRLELQSDAGDVQVVWNPTKVTIYDASSNTVYALTRPAKPDAAKPESAPTLAQISDLLTHVADYATVSDAQPSNVAGEPAYTVRVSPKHDGGLLGAAELAWDATHGVPLRAAVYAQGSSTPVLELEATQISFGPVADGDVDVAPPAGAKTVDLGALGKTATAPSSGASGLDAVKAKAGFPVVAPDTLVGLPRRDVRLIGSGDSPGVLVVYGQGLGAILLVEHGSNGAAPQGGPLNALPTISIDGVSGHELATQLGTVLQWQSGGTSFVLAGSLPSAAAGAAARDLR
jgi:outer membrane lipoprotein-sorting protein